MLKKATRWLTPLVFLMVLATPLKSAACPSGCTLVHMVCTEPPCNGFETLYLVLECNGQMQLCPVGCCG